MVKDKAEIETRVEIKEVGNRILRIKLSYLRAGLKEEKLRRVMFSFQVTKGEPLYVGLKRESKEVLEILIEELQKFRCGAVYPDAVQYVIREINKIMDSR